MHRTLRIPEILLNIFGHCNTESLVVVQRGSVDLAVLARTCRTFKEPALDVLWEKLYDLSPLVRCLPEACHLAKPPKMKMHPGYWQPPCYAFSRPLEEAEWITLRGYTRRIRFIRVSDAKITEATIRMIFPLTPFDDPLLPHLQSLSWEDIDAFSPVHATVPSLKSLHLDLRLCTYTFLPTKEIFNAFGASCPHMENLEINGLQSGPVDLAISDLVCHWPKLQRVACSGVVLNTDAISHLSSASNLKSLAFRTEMDIAQDISRVDSKLVFSSLTKLDVYSRFLDTISSLLHYIRLPALEMLSVVIDGYVSRWDTANWAALREACPSNVVTSVRIRNYFLKGHDIPLDEAPLPFVTLDVLRPCTTFAQLRGLDVGFETAVSLTDADLLELVPPCMEYLLINSEWGWQIRADTGGITLSGLVQLLRKCPLLDNLCLAIDTRTFTEIPEGLDVSFPPRRRLEIDLVDSYILPEFVPGLVSVFKALGLDPSQVSTNPYKSEFRPLWKSVLDALRNGS